MKYRLALIVITLSIMLAVFNFSTVPFAGGDNFAYYHLSRAIAQGKGYIELWDANLPLHTQYPPMFPVILLPAAILNFYTLAKVIVFICYILMLWFAYKLFEVLNGKNKTATIIALMLLAFAPVVIQYSSLVLSEIPYILFSVLALYMCATKRFGLALAFAVATFLTRTVGITLLIAVSWYCLTERRRNDNNV